MSWLFLVLLAHGAVAATVWTGPVITFTNKVAADKDVLTPGVALTRGASKGLYNAATEAVFTRFESPKGTRWANGTTANFGSLSYSDWNTWSKTVNGGPPSTVGKAAVVHLIAEDIYVDVKFLSWPVGGGFVYQRSTPSASNIPPTVGITTPVDGATVGGPAAVTFEADAADADGTVASVEFFEGLVSLGKILAAPYRVSPVLSVGSHSVVAVATDNKGATKSSAAVTVNVVANAAPVVAIVSPLPGAVYGVPARVVLSASASDADGTVAGVRFLDNGVLLAEVTSAPFSILTTLAAGTHELVAVASDDRGSSTTSSAVRVTITDGSQPGQPAFLGLSLATRNPAPPLSPAKVPPITNGLATLRWTGEPRGLFDLHYSATPDNASSWKLAHANLVGSPGGTNTLVDPPYLAGPAFPSNTSLFYRLEARPPQSPGLPVALQIVASNLVSPTVLTHAHDGSGRLFIADQSGQIRVVDAGGRLLSAPFLDLASRMVTLSPGYDERGLLGLAFHPGYATNGRFFVYYAAPSNSPAFNNMTVLSEFSVSAADPNLADPASELRLLTVDQPESNHEGADIAFGPDGYLYLGLGDGGGAGDQHGSTGNGQKLSTFLGKMLRLDVDSGFPYSIPRDNPFLETPDALPEIYAYGLRNPWRFSFDRGGDRAGYVADVGQNVWEELNILRPGANYGWRILEGSRLFDQTVASALQVDVRSTEFPIYEYAHGTSGIAIIGGFVYRGAAYPELVGRYVFGDFSTSFGSPDGQLYYLEETRPGIRERFSFQLWPGGGRLGRYVKGFGQDENGELYLLSTTRLGPAGTTGDVRKLVRP